MQTRCTERITMQNKAGIYTSQQKIIAKHSSVNSGYHFAADSRLRTNAWAIATSGEPVGTPGNGPEEPAMSM